MSKYLPGVGLAAAIGLAAWGIQRVEERVVGHAVIEALVIAILLGTVVRTFCAPGPRWAPGIDLTAKWILEVAIVLLGASVDLPALLRGGPALAALVVTAVFLGIATGVAIGRALGLSPELSVLVACGNGICGNSAIAAVAPVIGAEREEVASSIAFTAVVGVIVVLTLPLLIPLLGLSHYQYGVLAGMTVYAVPQVLAATFPVSTLSGQVGTLVKLMRVLLLGPTVLFFALRRGRRGEGARLSIGRVLPWFVVGFLFLAVLRSLGILPAQVAEPAREVSRWLTVAAMAALGLGVDVRDLGRVGRPVALAAGLSLVFLVVLAAGLIRGLGIG
ncbi:MAG TPA: putative sulfate exporter family transporter [Longimicrobiaceae bacterium]|nr:putative sulfate exporter family transporter [Longimicrobiaceae bacterium]